MTPTKQQRKAGFTVTELMVASTISLMVGASLLGSLYGLSKSVKMSIDETDATMENLSLMRHMEADLRGVSTVISKSNNKFHFITKDKFGNQRELYYRKTGSGDSKQLLRNEVSGSNVEETVLNYTDDGLIDVTFTYYTQMGDTPNTAADTNAIKIKIEREIRSVTGDIDRDIEISMIMFRNKIYDL